MKTYNQHHPHHHCMINYHHDDHHHHDYHHHHLHCDVFCGNGIIKRSRGWEQTPRKLRWISYFSPTSPLFSRRGCFLGQVPPFLRSGHLGPAIAPSWWTSQPSYLPTLCWEEYRAGDILTTFNLAQEETVSFSPSCLHTWSGRREGPKKKLKQIF